MTAMPDAAPRGLDDLVARSRAMARVVDQVRKVARSTVTILLEGESGTGKRHLARAIHAESGRAAGAFVHVRCAAVEERGEFERALFGGAATGDALPGAIERAQGGTLFLEEVAALSPDSQVALLRALQSRHFEPAAGGPPALSDARLVTSTRHDLAAAVRAGGFRDDLRDRLAVALLHVPPLRERAEDLPALVERFVAEFAAKHGRRAPAVSRGALDRLVHHPWPGNVRELRHTLEDMVALAGEGALLDVANLPAPLRRTEPAGETLELAVGMTVEDAERRLILATLRHTEGDKPRAAALLGIGLRTLYRKLARYAREERPARAKPRRATRR